MPRDRRGAIEEDAAAGERNGKRVALADEARDEGRGRRIVDRIGRADLLDAALVEDDDAVGELDRLLLVVGDEDGGVAGLVVDLAEPAAQLAADLGIERAEGLVEEQQARLDGERPGKRDTLALAAGKLGREAARKPVEPDQTQQFQDAVADLGLARPAGARPRGEAEGDVVEDAHVAEERVVLEDEADMALADAEPKSVLAGEQHQAGGGEIEAGEDAQERRLAGARGPEQGDELAGVDIERNAMERRRRPEQALDGLDRHVHGNPSSAASAV